MSERRQPVMSERHSRTGHKNKGSRSSVSNEVIGLRGRGKFVNKYLANEEQASVVTAEQPDFKEDESRKESVFVADQKLDKINVNHIKLGTPRSVEELSLIDDDRLRPKHMEVSFNEAAKQEEVEVKDGPQPLEDISES